MKVDVSVCLVTYNHERFIARAIEGALMQQTPFSTEIVITDDCSTDRTLEVVQGFIAGHPGRIRLIARRKNVGGNRNFAEAFVTCDSRYIALLDGDDYWTSPDKLKKQVQFLDARPHCVACFHPVNVFHEGGLAADWVYRPREIHETYELRDLLQGNQFQTVSAMVRGGLIRDFPQWYFPLRIGDWPLYAMLAEHGSLGYIDEVMGTYRVHAGGLWSGQDRVRQLLDRLAAYDAVGRFFQHRHDSVIRPVSARTCQELAAGYEARNEFAAARRYALRALSLGGWRQAESRKTLLRMLMRFLCPPAYNAARALHRKVRGRAQVPG